MIFYFRHSMKVTGERGESCSNSRAQTPLRLAETGELMPTDFLKSSRPERFLVRRDVEKVILDLKGAVFKKERQVIGAPSRSSPVKPVLNPYLR